MARDVTEFIGSYDMGPPKRWSSLRVAYHSACSMQHGQRIIDEPRKLLRNAGFTVVEVPEGHLCCGSAGSYNILQPAIAADLRDRKVDNIKSVRPDLVATGNIGCLTQLAGGMDIPIAHTVELLDWAYGGPMPRGLEALARARPGRARGQAAVRGDVSAWTIGPAGPRSSAFPSDIAFLSVFETSRADLKVFPRAVGSLKIIPVADPPFLQP